MLQEAWVNPVQKDLYQTLKENGPMIRRDIVKALDKPRTTLYDNLAVLVNMEVVGKFKRMVNSRGRPVVYFALKKDIPVEVN